MKLIHCLIAFILISVAVIWEYLALKFSVNLSFLHLIKNNTTLLNTANLSTRTGSPVSLALGITGFVFMLLTNLYSLRKRFDFMDRFGSAESFLNSHILFGLIGVLLVTLHTDFKLGGIAAVSFWSLIIVTITGVTGDIVNPNLDDDKAKGAKGVLGYWHSLHIPFSIVMYIFAIIHIIVASMFTIGIKS